MGLTVKTISIGVTKIVVMELHQTKWYVPALGARYKTIEYILLWNEEYCVQLRGARSLIGEVNWYIDAEFEDIPLRRVEKEEVHNVIRHLRRVPPM